MALTKGNKYLPETPESPAKLAEAVTPADGSDLPSGPCKSLYVGGAGNIVVHMAGDDAQVTFVGVVAGSILPIQVARVRATSTTATNIVALY